MIPNGELIAFRANDHAYDELARYKVSESPTYSYPVISGNRVIVKDKDSLSLWMIQ